MSGSQFTEATEATEAEARLAEFAEEFGGDGQFEVGIVKATEALSQVCGIFFGPDAADAGLDAMLRRHLHEVVDQNGWRGALEEEMSGLYSELPVGTLFHNLQAYADYGILTQAAVDADRRRERLAGMIAEAETFLRLIPAEGWGLEGTQTIVIARKAVARWRLENGKPITGPDLVLLSGKAEQTVKNNLGTRGDRIGGTWKEIDARAALEWLISKGFKESIWQHQDDSAVIEVMREPLEDVVFVPVAVDGSVFHPGLRKDGAYAIGPEGADSAPESFEEALGELQAMRVPAWRRPASGGLWTRVKGVEWRRMTRVELERVGAVEA